MTRLERRGIDEKESLSFLFISFLIHPARPITDFDSKKWDTRFYKKEKRKGLVRFVIIAGEKNKKNRNNYSKYKIYIYMYKKRYYLNYKNISLEKEGSF